MLLHISAFTQLISVLTNSPIKEKRKVPIHALFMAGVHSVFKVMSGNANTSHITNARTGRLFSLKYDFKL